MENPINKSVLEISKSFDISRNDIETTKKLISKAKEMKELDEISKIQLYYSIGTAFSNLILQTGDNIEEYTRNQIYYFRKSINNSKKVEKSYINQVFVYPILCSLFTNYANVLDFCGRKQSAIAMYREAIYINPEFTMAIGNLACSLKHFSNFMEENESLHVHKEIVNYLEKSCTIEDPNRTQEGEECFRNELLEYNKEELEYLKNYQCSCKEIVYNEVSLEYREWCWDNILYLNSLNDLFSNDAKQYSDNLVLPGILEKNDRKIMKIESMFNQIKQEYIYTRYLCFESMDIGGIHYADEKIDLIDCLDYTQYSIRIEKLKTAFKIAYSLLDKVGMFLNEYFDLKINSKNVSFHSIWYKKHGLVEKIHDNIGLYSIYWIAKDFENGENSETANPKSKKLQLIRNFLEHRFTNITLDITENYEIDANDNQVYITETDLREMTVELLKLVRETIFSLKNTVRVNEEYKIQNIDKKKVFPIKLIGFDEKYKI